MVLPPCPSRRQNICYIRCVPYDHIYFLGDYETIQHDEKLIRWQYIEPMNTLQEYSGAQQTVQNTHGVLQAQHECPCCSTDHQFGSSVADAEDFLREDTAKEEFAGSEETTQFFRKVYCFSICYTRKLYTEEDQNSTVFRKYEVGGTISGRNI